MIKKKRSLFTKYYFEQVMVYEYLNNFFVIQRAQQGIEMNPIHGDDQRPSENAKLFAKLSCACEDVLMGTNIIDALNMYDTDPPDGDPWDSKIHAANLKKWLGARGQKDIKINARVVDAYRWLDRGGILEIRPYDNCNINNWCGPMERKYIVTLPASATSLEVGQAVRQSFNIATHHPSYLAK